VEGNSVRGTARLCDVEKRTVLNILKLAGENCERILTDRIQQVPVRQVQADEIWTFVQKKEGHKWPSEKDANLKGDAYTFIAIERHTKLVLAWHLGRRDTPNAIEFARKLRVATFEDRFEFCTDAFGSYVAAVNEVLYDRVNYSQITKVYGKHEEGRERYSPAEFVTVEKAAIRGNPDLANASTSHIERKNGSLRQWCKRLTRLTYAFSKKWDNLKSALALHFAYYNFCRVHSSLRVTPAMEAGITNRVWELSDLVSPL
jgi:IS1 family transposase